MHSRKRNGLKETTSDEKNFPQKISENYVDSPDLHNLSELNKNRKNVFLKQ